MSDKVINPDKQRLFDAMKDKASEITIILSKHNKDYTLGDYTDFALITLLNTAHIVPEIANPIKLLLNIWIDAKLQLEETSKDLNNGILSLEKKSNLSL